MTDLERVMALYDSLNIKYEVLKRKDCANDKEFYGHIAQWGGKYPEHNETLTIEDSFYWVIFEFKDGKFLRHYLTE